MPFVRTPMHLCGGMVACMLIFVFAGCGGGVDASSTESAADASSQPAGPRVINLTGTDQMKYNITEIEASAGETITVNLTNIGKIPKVGMAHNFVLLKPGTDAETFALSAAIAGASGYIPQDALDAIIVRTNQAGPGETVSVTFDAPSEPGRYQYLCTFPGHFLAGMGGVLVVK